MARRARYGGKGGKSDPPARKGTTPCLIKETANATRRRATDLKQRNKKEEDREENNWGTVLCGD